MSPLVISGLDSDTLSRLMEVLSVQEIPWRKLAEKLGMMTLTHLYEDSPTPCHKLLQLYQLGGGPVEGLVEAFQSLGVTEGVRLLTRASVVGGQAQHRHYSGQRVWQPGHGRRGTACCIVSRKYRKHFKTTL
ncbi:hypothetical protein WMY93_018330 [Mugilogobius chulae]|uniref:Death domain-containing protein n=1 Tax=Mugilogobius chulae TaxID=88201 RepID=A0AAW0NVB8_9GOBI